jgi:VWFA-related protein
MKKGRAASTSIVIALGLLSRPGFGQEPAAIPAFPTAAEAITADVVVLDKDGRPVRGLKRDDFTFLVDGKPQPIVAFEGRDVTVAAPPSEAAVAEERVATNEGPATGGRTFAFLLDDLGTYPVAMEEGKRAIVRWLREKADSRDEVTLATSSGNVWWSDRLDRGRDDLIAVLDRVKGAKLSDILTDWEAYRIVSFEGSRGGAAESNGPVASAAGPPGGGSVSSANPLLIGDTLTRVATRTGKRAGEVEMLATSHYNTFNRSLRALLGATGRLSRGLAGARGRKSILIFSDGFLYDVNQRALFDRSIDASQRANTAVYFVGVGGLKVSSGSGPEAGTASSASPDGTPSAASALVRETEEIFLESAGTEMVAESTGGSSIRDTNDLLGGLNKVAAESSTYYLLGYQPEKAPDGKWHKLEVKVARPGLTVRTRRGYQATPTPSLASLLPVAKGKHSDKKGDEKRPLDPAVMTNGAANAVPLRIAPYVLDADKTGLARVLIVLELDTSRLALRNEGERRTGAVDLTLIGTSRDQSKVFPLDERVRIDVGEKAAGGWMSLSRELRLPAGVAQVRALVRDVASGLAGTVTQRLEVPELGGPYLATPIVTDRMIMGADKTPRLVPVAYRNFRPQGYLYCSYEVLGMSNTKGEATTRVTGAFTLRASGGQIVRQAAPTPIAVAVGGKVVRLFALPLEGLGAGDYDLVLDVVDEGSGRKLQSHEPFVLASNPA